MFHEGPEGLNLMGCLAQLDPSLDATAERESERERERNLIWNVVNVPHP